MVIHFLIAPPGAGVAAGAGGSKPFFTYDLIFFFFSAFVRSFASALVAKRPATTTSALPASSWS